jgi:hypothetical protein
MRHFVSSTSRGSEAPQYPVRSGKEGDIWPIFAAALAIATEAPPSSMPQFQSATLPRSEAGYDNGFRLAVADSGEEVVTVATWVAGGVPFASTAAAQLWFSRDLGRGWTVQDAYAQVGAGSEAVVTPDGTLFIAVGPRSSLDMLLTLEQARWTTAESRVSEEIWSVLQRIGAPWVRREGELEAWTHPLLVTLYPDAPPRAPGTSRSLAVSEVRALARELYRPGNAATLVVGDFDDDERAAVMKTFGVPSEHGASGFQATLEQRLVTPLPSDEWAESGGGTPVTAVVGWSLPGRLVATPAELEAVRSVASEEIGRRKFEESRCDIQVRIETSTLVCSVPVKSRAQARRRIRFLRTAVRSTRVSDYVEDFHTAWARDQIRMMGSASWQRAGRARSEGLAFGQTGRIDAPRAAEVSRVAELLRSYVTPARSVGMVLPRPSEDR